MEKDSRVNIWPQYLCEPSLLLFWPFQETIPKKTAVAGEDTKTNKLNEGFCDKTKEGGKSLREINFLFHFFVRKHRIRKRPEKRNRE